MGLMGFLDQHTPSPARSRARIDRGKAYVDVQAMHSKNAAALWIAARSWYPEAFQDLIYRQLRLQPQAASPGVNGVP